MNSNPRPSKTGFVILAAIALAAVPAPSLAEIPPGAQPAFNKGVLAAQQQEWGIAFQSFQEARKIAPATPEIYYNLGLTEAKIPGRELRAIAWLAAYLAAVPAAPNAPGVKSAILGLLVKNEGNIDRFIEVTRQAAEQVPPGALGNGKEYALSKIFALYAEEGDEAKAASLVSEAHLDQADLTANSALLAMTEFGGRDGVERARILVPSQPPQVRSWIARGEAKIGDVAGALKDIALIPDDQFTNGDKAFALIAVARAQFKAGQKQASWKTLENARAAMQKVYRVGGNDYAYVCDAQVSVGDLAGARATADIMDRDIFRDLQCLEKIAKSQLAIGDVQAAQSTANHIDDSTYREKTQDEIDQYNKDPVGTKSALAADQIVSTNDWLDEVNSGTGNQRIAGTSAADWVSELDNTSYGLGLPVIMDFSAYVKSVTGPDASDPERMLVSTAQALLVKRRFVTKMLATQFGPGFLQ